MIFTREIYQTKKYISKKEWLEFIKKISYYNGLFRRWKIIIRKNKNQIQYYVKTRCSLPPTINNLNSFLLKSTPNIKKPKQKYTFFVLPKIGSSLIDIINKNEIKKRKMIRHMEINFIRILNDKIISYIEYYTKERGVIIKYIVLYAIPESILSVDYEINKRFFIKNTPKYLDINKIIYLLDTSKNNAILKVDTFPYLQGEFYLNQNNYSFDKHSIIIGSSGCGKSKFISLLINNIYKNNNIKQKYRVVLIDPHASLENDIGGIGKVIDFRTTEDSINLFTNNTTDIIKSTELILELLKNLIADQYNSKLERVLRHTISLLLASNELSFINIRKILLNLEYRNNIINNSKENIPISVIDFFLTDFNDLKTKSYTEAISPIISFLDEMEMIPVFNEEQNNNNLVNTINKNFLTIFSLDRTNLGNKITKTISGLIMEQLLNIIQRREIEEHIIFIIDEVPIIENPILKRFLSESRKYKLSLIIAGQYFNQISEELKESIFANVINYYIFRVSKQDANTLVNNFNMKIPLNDTKENKIKLLTELNNRECIVRIGSNDVLLPAFKSSTLDYKEIPRIKKNISKPKQNQIKVESKKIDFSIDNNIKLDDILKSNSTSRKEINK